MRVSLTTQIARIVRRKSLLAFTSICPILLTLPLMLTAHAGEAQKRLFIQVWWDSPTIEMDPSDDPGRIEVYVGETFVGCAIAPSHLNYRKQLMLVPPSLGFAATGAPSAVRITVTGHLGALPGRQVKVTGI